MIQCRNGVDFGDKVCKSEARWEIKPPASWSHTWFACGLHLQTALRKATTKQSLTDAPRATVGRL